MAKWKHKIQIKHLFKDETTPELMITLCKELLRQLEPLVKKYETIDISYADDIYWDLEAVTDNFEFLLKLADGRIGKNSWDDYSFNGDFEEAFNDYLEQLYDLGDTRIDNDKFIWIG